MNARQQEPPSSHLHGAGHNTSISRQRRTTKNKVGYSLPFLFLEISDGQIGSRSECRSRCRCQTLTRRRSEQEHRQQYIHSRADKRSQRQRTGSRAHGSRSRHHRICMEQVTTHPSHGSGEPRKTRWGIRCRFYFWKYQMARSGADQSAGADAGVRL